MSGLCSELSHAWVLLLLSLCIAIITILDPILDVFQNSSIKLICSVDV